MLANDNDPSQFVTNRLRSKPVSYCVEIDHFVCGGDWQMSITVKDVAPDPENRKRIAADLRAAAEILELADDVNVDPGP